MSHDLVRYETRSPAVVLTINRADRRNALSRGLITALTDAFNRVHEDAAARCVILTGAGSVFCAGMDLAELQESLAAGTENSPVWDDALEGKLRGEWDALHTGRSWETSAPSVRRGWDYATTTEL